MKILEWNELSDAERARVLARPAVRADEECGRRVREILDSVRRRGDAAVLELTEALDGVRLERFEVSAGEFAVAEGAVSSEAHAALERARGAIEAFHLAQMRAPIRVETVPGVVCERIAVPIRAVGLYVPAGSAPLPSTALMLGVPAGIAGCPTRVLCTPPRADGSADPAVLVAARKVGLERVFKVGGAQAIAAMGYGTGTIPRCDKVFGPGNIWVTTAKALLAVDSRGAAIDLPAGPTEVLVVADESARAEFVAADLLAQAEHGVDAQALLVTTSRGLAERVIVEVERQRAGLPRQEILSYSLAHLRVIVVGDLEQALEVANAYAPEHLILAVREPRRWLGGVSAAGGVFLGHWSTETLGDYCAGPNHTLPTFGWARAISGLGVEDFQKQMAVLEVSAAGLRGLAGTARVLAGMEGLAGHAAAVTIRVEALEAGRGA